MEVAVLEEYFHTEQLHQIITIRNINVIIVLEMHRN